MEYNVRKSADYRYLKRYLRTMRRIRFRRERMGLCLLLFCAALYLSFAGAYRDLLIQVEEDHRMEYVLPGHAPEKERLQLEFNLIRGEFSITREISGEDPARDNAEPLTGGRHGEQ